MTPERRADLIGSLWMVAAMAGFAIEDTFLKLMSTALPVGQLLMLFGGGGALVFALLARRNDEPLYSVAVVSFPMRIRVAFEVSARLFYMLALALTPLSSATVIMQAIPLVVVAGAAIFFGEKVGLRRWIAIFIGLVGVAIIIQPGTDGFSMLSILALLGMLGFAGRDLASRAAPVSLSTSILGLYGFLTIVLAGIIFSLWDQVPFVTVGTTAALWLAGAVFTGVASYSALMKAMRTGDVSAVTPFRYTRLLFGIGLGVALFDEQLETPMIVGSGLIVLSGMFILWRKKVATQ